MYQIVFPALLFFVLANALENGPDINGSACGGRRAAPHFAPSGNSPSFLWHVGTTITTWKITEINTFLQVVVDLSRIADEFYQSRLDEQDHQHSVPVLQAGTHLPYDVH